jgi:hypothetical protein
MWTKHTQATAHHHPREVHCSDPIENEEEGGISERLEAGEQTRRCQQGGLQAVNNVAYFLFLGRSRMKHESAPAEEGDVLMPLYM